MRMFSPSIVNDTARRANAAERESVPSPISGTMKHR